MKDTYYLGPQSRGPTYEQAGRTDGIPKRPPEEPNRKSLVLRDAPSRSSCLRQGAKGMYELIRRAVARPRPVMGPAGRLPDSLVAGALLTQPPAWTTPGSEESPWETLRH